MSRCEVYAGAKRGHARCQRDPDHDGEHRGVRFDTGQVVAWPRECAWCGNPVPGVEHTGLPAHDVAWRDRDDWSRDDDLYCSAACIEKRVADLMHRRKQLVVTGRGIGGLPELKEEKWPRFTAEVPPELAVLLDSIHRRGMGVNAAHASRAGIVRAGLRLYLREYARAREPAIDAEAEEIGGELE